MTEPASSGRGEVDGRPTPREALIWGLLVVMMLALIGLSLWRRGARPTEAPEVLGAVPEFALTNRDGSVVTREALLGAPWVANFFFTRCVGICPRLSARMDGLVDRLGARSPVRFVSITVDPEADTPERLETYAARFDAPPRWYFLTGALEAIHSLVREGFLLAVEPNPEPGRAPAGEDILHSNRFVLVDAEGRVRGYYDAFDEAAMAELLEDIETLAPQ